MSDASSIRYGSSAVSGEENDSKLLINFRPLGTKVCVRPISGEMTTKSGLIVPTNSAGEAPQEGWVMAIGRAVPKEEEKQDTPEEERLKVGDRVLFSRYAGDEIRIKDERGVENEFKILHYESLIGVSDVTKVSSKHDEQENTPKVNSPEVRTDEKISNGKGGRKKRKQKEV